ncbi:MAG: 50S ribosomal protein L21 [Candidatus Aminicenantia bacterium]
MFAIIQTGGKQYKVQEGDKIRIEKLDQQPGAKIIFDRVLFIEDNGKTIIGTPFIPEARVEGTILENIKAKKVIIFKKKSKKGYKKKTGHRQRLAEVQIGKIVPKWEPKLEKKAEPEKEIKMKAKPKPKVRATAKKSLVKADEKAPVVKEAKPKAKDKAEPKKKAGTKKKVKTTKE